MADETRNLKRKASLPALLGLALILVSVLGGVLLRSRTPAYQTLASTPRVVVLLVPGASLDDLSAADSSFADHAAVGVFPNRLSHRVGDARLTTLNPAASADVVAACGPLGEKLGDALARAQIVPAALGGDPAARAFLGVPVPSDSADAALLAYDNEDAESGWRKEEPDAVGGFVTDSARLAQAITKAARSAAAPALWVATFDDLLRCDSYAPLSRSNAAAGQRRAALRRLETLFVQLTGPGPTALPPETSLLVIGAVPSAAAAERGEMLGPVLLWQRTEAPTLPGLLTSPSTRLTPGLIAPGDLAAAVQHLLSISGAAGTGRPPVILETGNPPSGDALYLTLRVAAWSAQFREIQYLVYFPWLLAAALLAAALLATEKIRSACAAGIAAAPVALLLAAPLASPEPGKEWAVYAAASLMALAAFVAARLLAGWKGADSAVSVLRAVCVFTAAIVLLDTLTGGILLARSPLSYSPVAAARFYGIGNEISGVFLGAAIFAVGIFCPTPLGAALGGAAIALLSGMPMLGADAGGFVAGLISFGTLFVLLMVARSPNKRRTAGTAGLGAGAVVLALLSLYIFGNGRQSAATRTHVGEAVASAQAQGGGALLPLIHRKAATGLRLLVTSPWSALLLTELGLCVWLWRRPSDFSSSSDTPPAAYLSGFVAAGALLLVNDSGVIAAATCLLFPTASLLLAKTPRLSSAEPNDPELSAAND